jgi:hypothetical protein
MALISLPAIWHWFDDRVTAIFRHRNPATGLPQAEPVETFRTVFVSFDAPFAYSSACTWFGRPEEAEHAPVTRGADLSCPVCGEALVLTSYTRFWRMVNLFDAGLQGERPHQNYSEFFHWLQNRCYPDTRAAAIDFNSETGKTVDITE